MLIISKITHKKNALIRILHSHYEAGNVCKFLIVKGFENLRTHNAWSLSYTKESFQQLKTLFPYLKIITATKKKNKIQLATIAKAKIIKPLDRILTQKMKTKMQNHHKVLHLKENIISLKQYDY